MLSPVSVETLPRSPRESSREELGADPGSNEQNRAIDRADHITVGIAASVADPPVDRAPLLVRATQSLPSPVLGGEPAASSSHSHRIDCRTALITGASSGIGLELARILADEGVSLVLVSRSADDLRRLAEDLARRHQIRAEAVPLDLAVAGSADELVARLRELDLEVDILINDAGFATCGNFAEADPETELRLLQLNIVTVTHLTRLLLPGMIARRRGRILNIASIGSYIPGPMVATYFASKAYVLSFTEAIAHELRGSGVTATALVAGPTRTHFAERAGLSETPAFRGRLMEAQCVARCAYRAMMRGKRVAVAGWLNKMRMIPIRLLPRWLITRFAHKYHLPLQGACRVEVQRKAQATVGVSKGH